MTNALSLPISGFRCPVCLECNTDVRDSRPRTDGYIYRRRYCNSCTTPISTVEIPADLWSALDVHGSMTKAALSLNDAIRHFNAAKRATREAHRSRGAEIIRRKV